jgi:hypothetical protein
MLSILVGFEVPTAVIMKDAILWDIAPYGLYSVQFNSIQFNTLTDLRIKMM